MSCRFLKKVGEHAYRTGLVTGTMLLACAVAGCLFQEGKSADDSEQGKWVVARFEIVLEPFANEPAQTVSFLPLTLNVLKWESVLFAVQGQAAKPLEYYGAVGIGPVGKDAEMVKLTELLPAGTNATFKGNKPKISVDGNHTVLEWSFAKVAQATPGSCSCSAVLFPEVVQYSLSNPNIQGRRMEVRSRTKPDIWFGATISDIQKASMVSVIFSFKKKDAQGNRILALLSASNDWETREEGEELLIGASFDSLSERKVLEFSLNVSARPGLDLIPLNQETSTGKKVSSCGVIVESSRSFFGNLTYQAEGFRTERLSYTREAYAFPELVLGT